MRCCLKYKPFLNNGINAVVDLCNGTLTINDPDVTLCGKFNNAVYGRAIYAKSTSTVNIGAGTFEGISAKSSASGLSAVTIQEWATANISGGTFRYKTDGYTPTTPFPGLYFDGEDATASLSGGTYENGIKVPEGKTIDDYLATNCVYSTSGTTGTVTPPYVLSAVSATITVPVAGKTPDYQPVSGNSDKYTVTSKWWRIDEQGIKKEIESDPFLAGETYSATIMFTAKGGYCFNDSTTAKVNGSAATRGFASSREQCYNVEFTVPAAATPVSNFTITNLTAPTHGVAADYTASVTNAGFTVTRIRYGIRTTGLTTVDPYTGNAGDALEIAVEVTKTGEVPFASGSKATWNGIESTATINIGNSETVRTYVFKYTVPAATTELTSVSATVTAPVAGALPSATATVPDADNDKYGAFISRWFRGGTYAAFGPQMGSSETFVAGETYFAELTFTPKAGYSLTNAITAEVNGKSYSCNSRNTNTGESHYIVAFTVPAIPQYNVRFTNGGNVTFTGNDKAIHGQAYTCTLTPDSGYTLADNAITVKVSGIDLYHDTDWHYNAATGQLTIDAEHVTQYIGIYGKAKVAPTELTSVSVTVTAPVKGEIPASANATAPGFYVASTDWEPIVTTTFAAGTVYTVKITVEAEDGYEFAATPSLTVNGNTATKISSSADQFIFTYQFPVTEQEHTHSYGEWQKDETNHWHECGCGNIIDTATHTFGEWTVTKEATATESGSKEQVCSLCGYKETVEIPKTGTPTDPTNPGNPGDIDGNGKIDIIDLSMLKQYLMRVIELSSNSYKAADINNDGKVNVFDFIRIKKMLLNN